MKLDTLLKNIKKKCKEKRKNPKYTLNCTPKVRLLEVQFFHD